jgi:hypothetical protein
MSSELLNSLAVCSHSGTFGRDLLTSTVSTKGFGLDQAGPEVSAAAPGMRGRSMDPLA